MTAKQNTEDRARRLWMPVAVGLTLAACSGSDSSSTTATSPAPTTVHPTDGAPIGDAAARQLAKPPFHFAEGSPRALFAGDPELLARWSQAETLPGWGKHADVTGGPSQEWLVAVGGYALVVSSEAGGFWYRDFGSGSVSEMDARPLEGGAKNDVVVRYWLQEGDVRTGYSHEILEVWSFDAAGPVIDLAIELHTYARCCGSEARASSHTYTQVTLHDNWIELVPEKPWHVDPDKFKPTTPPDVEPSVPWGVKRRAYRWDGSRLSATDER